MARQSFGGPKKIQIAAVNGQAREVSANGEGVFRIQELAPGAYAVSVSQPAQGPTRSRLTASLDKKCAGTHRRKRVAVSLGFRSVEGALRTIQGYEAMNKIRKGQIRWLAKGDAVEQVRFIHQTFGVAA